MAYFNDQLDEEVTSEEVKEEVVEADEVETAMEETPAEQEVEVIDKNGKKTKKKGVNKAKATVSELKKVTWPSFGKVCKQTVVVLSVTAVFLLVVLGLDQLLYLLYNLLTKNM